MHDSHRLARPWTELVRANPAELEVLDLARKRPVGRLVLTRFPVACEHFV